MRRKRKKRTSRIEKEKQREEEERKAEEGEKSEKRRKAKITRDQLRCSHSLPLNESQHFYTLNVIFHDM